MQVLPEVTLLDGLVPGHLAVWAHAEHIPSVTVTADHQVLASMAARSLLAADSV